jgi:multidrug resistance efflux pump
MHWPSEGARVKKGDLLFQADPRPLHAVVDQARARVEAAKTQLTEANGEVDQGKCSEQELKSQLHRPRSADLIQRIEAASLAAASQRCSQHLSRLPE